MKPNKSNHFIVTLALLAWLAGIHPAAAQGTAFTYQGRLTDGTNVASGSYDLKFSLYDATTGGNQIGASLTNTAVGINNGLYLVVLDFGGVFTGDARWLEMGVRSNSSGADFTLLSPRQELTPTPYAMYAPQAGTATNLAGPLPGGQLAGTYSSAVTFDNPANSFSGDGGSLTNLNVSAAQLASVGNSNGGSGNFFVGASGNSTTSGSDNTANGLLALFNNTSGSYNTANGYNALGSNLGGLANAAHGAWALYCNTNGSYNTANGSYALYSNTRGNNNTANGAWALYFNSDGSWNTANGYRALNYNTNGSYNTANGSYALYSNTNGNYNTANGGWALRSNTSGNNNTASGANALYFNTSGSSNAADGVAALLHNTSGDKNTAIGQGALSSNTSGSSNIALGCLAGDNLTTGDNNIDIGNQGYSTDTNIIRIGSGQVATYIAGISAVTLSPSGGAVYINADGQLGTVNSSRQFKEAIQDMAGQSDILLSLRPVAFHYKPDLDPQATPQFGLIAEEVEQVAPQLVLRDAKGEVTSVRYEQVNAMLLNEFLKEHRKVEAQGTEIRDLKARLEKLEILLAHQNGGER